MVKRYRIYKTIRIILIAIAIITVLLSMDHNYKLFSTIMAYTAAISATIALFISIPIAILKRKIQEELTLKQLEHFENKK